MHVDPYSFWLGLFVGIGLWIAFEAVVIPAIMHALAGLLVRFDDR